MGDSVPNPTKSRVLIVGAGIGGLTAALALLQRGFDVEVYEQAQELREVGAGLHLSSNAMLVFSALGIADHILASAVEPTQRLTRLWNTGRAWKTAPVARTTFGFPFVSMYRPDLLDVLVSAVRKAAPNSIHLNHKIVGCAQDGDGVSLRFANGECAGGDVLVGADGIHSKVRQTLHGEDNAEFTGLVVWRATIPVDRLPEHFAQPVSTAWIGPGRHIVQYPVRSGNLINFGGVVERSDWQSESWNTVGNHSDMRQDFKGWHQDIQTQIDAIQEPYIWALKLRRPLPKWSSGRITLLGDACHPTLPFLAQGAAMAIEDGFVLARAFEAHSSNIEAALCSYESARKERTTRIINSSAANTKRFHNPELADPDSAQKYMDREFGEASLRERMDWIYQYDARSVAV